MQKRHHGKRNDEMVVAPSLTFFSSHLLASAPKAVQGEPAIDQVVQPTAAGAAVQSTMAMDTAGSTEVHRHAATATAPVLTSIPATTAITMDNMATVVTRTHTPNRTQNT